MLGLLNLVSSIQGIWCSLVYSTIGKAIPLQAWTGPEDSRRLRLPDFRLAHEGGKVVSPTHRLPLPPRKYSWYLFLLGAESTSKWNHWESNLGRLVMQYLNQLRQHVPPYITMAEVISKLFLTDRTFETIYIYVYIVMFSVWRTQHMLVGGATLFGFTYHY
jgi:hypothetical protein